MKHIMHLNELPFQQLKEGSKLIEVRIYDNKRRKLNVRDEIKFISRTESEESLNVEIEALLIYKTFKDLFKDFKSEFFGGENFDDLMKIYNYYSKEEEGEFGVIGIKIKKI